MKKLKRKIAFILILVTFLIFVPISVIETVSSEYASKVKIALGQKAFEQKEYRKAIAHYLEAYKLLLDTTAVEMKEEKVSVRWRLAVNYGIIGEDDKAVQFCDEAHNLASKKEWNDYLFGRYAPTLIYSYYKVGKYEQAIEFYNKILKQNRTDRYSLYVRGLCYRAIGDHSNAFFDIEKAESTGFRKSQLEAYREVNEVIPEKDVKKVEHDLDPDPEKDDRVKESEQKTVENEAYISYYNKGTELNFKEKYNEALVEFRRALELEKNDSHVWNNVGVAFSGLNKRDDAIRCFEKAVELDPKNIIALNNLGDSYYDKGMDFLEAEKYREAIEEFKKALEIKDTDYEIWNNMGVVYGRLGERDEAIKCYEKAVELNPANAQVVNNLENSYFEREQYEKVIELSDKVLKKEPKNLIALFFKGKTYLALKRPSEAILWLQKAQKIEPKDTEVIEQLAWSYYSAGKFTESSKYMEQARKLGSREFIKELRWIEIFSKRPVTSSVESVMFGIVTSLLLIIFVLGILGIDFIFKWSEPQHAHFSEEEKQKPTRLVRSVTIISIVLGVLVIDQIGKSLALAYYTRFSEPLHSLGIKSLQGLIMSFFGVIRLSHIIEFGKNLALHSVVNMTTIMVLLLISVACIINIRFYERIGQFNNEEPQFKKKIAKTLFGIVEKFIYVVFFIPVLIISAVIDGAYFIVTKTVGLFYKGKSTGKYVSISEKKRLAKKPFKVSLLYYIVVSFGMGCTLSVSCDLLLGRAGVVDYLPFKIGLANFGDFVLLLLLCYFLELVKNGIVKVFRRFNKPEVRHKLKKFFYNLELSGIFRKKYSGRF